MLKKIGFKAGMNETTGRVFIGTLTLMDAINRAGSTDKKAIQKALQETNIPGSSLALPWEGVKFDSNGQNMYGGAIMTQWHDRQLKAICGHGRSQRPMSYGSCPLGKNIGRGGLI